MRSDEFKSLAVSNRAAFIFPHVVAESLFVEVPEKVERLDADVCSLESSLQEAPEVFKGVGVDRATNVLHGMVDGLVDVVAVESLVREKRVGIDDAASVNVLSDFALNVRLADVRSDQGTNHPATLDHTEYRSLVAGTVHGDAALADFFVHVARATADIGFVNFDFATGTAELYERIGLHGETDAMQHEPRGFLGDAERPVNFVGADAVLAVGDHPNGDKPLIERERRVLKDSPDLYRELLARMLRLALPHAPSGNETNIFASASWALDAIGPAALDHELEAVVRVGEVNDGLLQGLWLSHLGCPHSKRVAEWVY